MSDTIKYWWLGFNTKPQSTEADQGIYLNLELRAFLDGRAERFRWPTVGTNDSYARYDAMSSNHRVVIWTGGGGGYCGPWGVLGFAKIVDRSPLATNSGWIDLSEYELLAPITPYDRQSPRRTEHSDFLADLFGEEFQPLHKIFRDLKYPTRIDGKDTWRPSVTNWELDADHFWALHRRAKRLCEERKTRQAA